MEVRRCQRAHYLTEAVQGRDLGAASERTERIARSGAGSASPGGRQAATWQEREGSGRVLQTTPRALLSASPSARRSRAGSPVGHSARVIAPGTPPLPYDDLDPGVNREEAVFRHLVPLVPGARAPKLRRQRADARGKRVRDPLGLRSLRQGDELAERVWRSTRVAIAAPLWRSPSRQIALPLAANGSVCDLNRPS